jgi:hypothetical protein
MKQDLKVFSLAKDGLTGKRPFEDAFKYDAKLGVFAVADGVGLWKGIEYEGRYPRNSGSKKIAQAFCSDFVRHYKNNPNSNLLSAFRAGNAAAGRVNVGRSKYDVFRKHKGLFAATAAMAVIKNKELTWAHVCDAGVAVVGKDGKLKMKKDSCQNHFPMPRDIKKYDDTTWTLFFRTIARNAVSPTGESNGYGVITGEEEVEGYIEKGAYRLLPGDSVVLFSDGFAPYLELPTFRKLIVESNLEKDFRIGAEKIIKQKTEKVEQKLRGKKIDWLASVEVIMERARAILGKDAKEFEWAKEKSIIVVKV